MLWMGGRGREVDGWERERDELYEGQVPVPFYLPRCALLLPVHVLTESENGALG